MPQPSRRQFLAGAGAGAAALAIAGCSNAPSSSAPASQAGAMKNYQAGTQFKATEPVTFTIAMLSNPAYAYNANWPFFKYLKQLTNVSFSSTVIPYADYNTKVSALINAGQAPTIIPKVYPGEEDQYVAGGAILAVSDYVHLMPNFQAKVAKWSLQGNLDTLRQSNGKFYLLPCLMENVWQDYTLGVRTDILDKLRIPTPGTWAGVQSMMLAMKAAHPGHYPLSDRWNQPTPGGNFLNILSAAYGTAAGWGYQDPGNGAYWDSSSGAYVFAGAMPQYKAMVQFAATMYNQGLIDPESFTQADTLALQKLVSGKSFVISENAQYVVTDQQALPAGQTIAKLPLPAGPLGKVLPPNASTRIASGAGVVVSSKALTSPHFTALMQFLDWLYYSDAGQLFAKWGVAGLTYTGSVADGTFKLEPDVDWAGLNPAGKKELNVTYGFFNGVFTTYTGSTQLLDTQFPPAELAFQKTMAAWTTSPVPPPAPLTTAQQQQVTLTGTTLMDTVQSQTLEFITGKRPMSQWDSYVSSLSSAGGTQLASTYNGAYQAYKKKYG
ncbi:MAG TPA: twin-arginine translocation signal domain-containing protein [Trebonia sp.]|nr:twin-arginine translocation signal domain-containing protein [Trebonia sp.]